VAAGTLIVSIVMAVAMALFIYQQEAFKPFKFWRDWKHFKVSSVIETYRLGVQIAIAHAMEVGMFSAAALLIGVMGAEALAAHQIVLQCITLSFMLPLGLSQAVSVKVGKHFGAGNAAETRLIIKYGLVISSITATLAGFVFWLLPEVLVSFFVDESLGPEEFQSLLGTASLLLLVGAMFQLVDGWQVVLMGVLRGFKLGASPTIVATISYWGLGFPAAYFLGQSFGAVGVWSGMGFGLALSAFLLGFLVFKTYRKSF
jgi:MATE family multidrug resistance protein